MKVMSLLLALMLFLGGSACAQEEERTGADLSYARILEMTAYMRDLAMGDYLPIKHVPEELLNIAQGWAEGISGTPRMVLQLNVNDSYHMAEIRASFANEPEIVTYEAMSTVLVQLWQTLAYSAGQAAELTEASFEQIMQVNGLLNASMLYAEEGTQGNALYIVLYEHAAPIWLMVCGENGAVSITGMFLPDGRLARCKNYGQVALWLMSNGITMTCREIQPE